jgi:hypothetical protein
MNDNVEKYQLRATGRTADKKKIACMMWVSSEMVTIDGETASLEALPVFKSESIRTMEKLSKQPVHLESMKIAEVIEQQGIVTEADLQSGEFEGYELGDTWTDLIVLESYPVNL